MEPIEYVRAFRRRWWVIALCAIVAGAVGWTTISATPSTAVNVPSASLYTATAVLWNGGGMDTVGRGSPIASLQTLAEVVKLPDVAVEAAKVMKYDGDPEDLTAQMSASGGGKKRRRSQPSPFLKITGTGSDPQTAQAVAKAFSRGLVVYLGKLKADQLGRQQKYLKRQLSTLKANDDTTGAIPSIRGALAQIALDRATPIPLRVLQEPVAEPLETEGFRPPESRTTKLALAVLAGVVAGMILVLVMQRFDTRIRSRRQAEEAFGVPVLAEIPVLSRRDQRGVITTAQPVSQAADAFRLLVAGVRRGIEAPGVQTVVVTSPEPGDGKTTIAANLAAAFAEGGERVVVLSCDLGTPSTERLFGLPASPGVTDALLSTNGSGEPVPSDLTPYLAHPSGSSVSVMASGTLQPSGGEMVRSAKMQALIQQAKQQADVVILDCTPLSTAGDVVPLLAQADALVLVGRAGRTKTETAERSAELLRSLGADITGVVLNRVREVSGPGGSSTSRLSGGHRRRKPPPPQEPHRVIVVDEATEARDERSDEQRDMWTGRG